MGKFSLISTIVGLMQSLLPVLSFHFFCFLHTIHLARRTNTLLINVFICKLSQVNYFFLFPSCLYIQSVVAVTYAGVAKYVWYPQFPPFSSIKSSCQTVSCLDFRLRLAVLVVSTICLDDVDCGVCRILILLWHLK